MNTETGHLDESSVIERSKDKTIINNEKKYNSRQISNSFQLHTLNLD